MALSAPNAPTMIEYSIEDKILRYGGIEALIGVQIALAESNFNPLAQNSESTAKGVFQFLDNTMCKGDALNEDDNISCYFYYAEKNEYWRWTASIDIWYPKLSEEAQNHVDQYLNCSCVEGLRSFGVTLPPSPFNASEFTPNTTIHIGAVVIFNYEIGGSHVALVTNLNHETFSILEWNYKKCMETQRDVLYNDNSIIGFYSK